MNRNPIVARLFLAIAAAIFLLGAFMHANAFLENAAHVIDDSSLKVFFAREVKVLWLADSTTLAGLGVIFGLIAAKPTWATKPIILALAWIPAATTALLYIFLGPFFAAHMLAVATLMVVVSALTLPVHAGDVRHGAAASMA